MTWRVKQLLCQLLIGMLLFAQMAIAAYACPQLSPGGFTQPSAAPAIASDGAQTGSDASVSGSDAASPVADMAACCDGMGQPDPDHPNLCTEHALFGQQSDQTQTPTVPAVLLASLYIVSLVPELTEPTRPATASANLLAAASPPHAILHCCFRI
jgi:hypothetical protein